MTRPTFSVVSIASICLSLTATTASALPTETKNHASDAAILSPNEMIFQTSLTPVDLTTIDFAGALEAEAFKVGFKPHTLTTNEIEAALEQEVLQVSLDAASPAISANMQAREDAAFDVALTPYMLAAATVQNGLEGALFEIPLDTLSSDVVAAMQTREDGMFAVTLEPQVLTAAAIESALEYEVFKVAVYAPRIAKPATDDEMFAVSLEPRSLQSLNVPEELLTPAFIALRDLEIQSIEALPVSASVDLDVATTAAGSSRVAAQ